jgi:TPR repeat protein
MNPFRAYLIFFALCISTQSYSALDPEQKRVFEELKAKAISGDPESQHKMGLWYLVGHEPGIPKTDKKSAELWFLKAADKGFKESFRQLSSIYYDKFAYSKERNPNDLAESHKWRLLEINNDEAMKKTEFIGVFPLSEKTRADGEARAKKFRADRLNKDSKTSGK